MIDTQPILHDLLVDRRNRIWEVRVGRTNNARIFWHFARQRGLIVALCGYVKHGQEMDQRELARARTYKRDTERRAM